MFSVNPQSGVPIYRQLMEQIRRMISSGQMGPGDALPSVRELAVTHAVNPMTISKAYSLLEAEGLLERQRGKATIVSRDGGSAENKKERLRRLQPSIDQLVTAARQLQLGSDDVISALRKNLENRDE
jgi:GntR family transcriptional regulator